jgi:phage-related baseplate assembly protein
MSGRLPPEYAGLPEPAIVEEIGYETALAAKIARLAENFAAAGLPYSVSATQYDPAVIQLQGAAYDDMRLRQRINEAARANLLAFARGGDLDQIGLFHGVARMVGEDDDRYAYRIVLRVADRNSGGTAPRIEFLAMTADLRVKDVVAFTVGRSPVIHLPVLATDNDGVADAPLLAAVDAAVNDPANRMVNDTIVPAAAVRQVVAVAADVWLLPDAPMSDLDAIEPALRAAWAADGKLGRDLTASWLARELMRGGVQRAENILPATTIAPFDQAIAIGTVALSFKGRAY